MKHEDLEGFVSQKFDAVFTAIKAIIDDYNSKDMSTKLDCFDEAMGLIRKHEYNLWGYIDGLSDATPDCLQVMWLDTMKTTYRTFLHSYREIYMK